MASDPIKINWYVFGLALFYLISESVYFGWNFRPKSDAEMVCDGIGLIIGAMCFR